ncbi:MAG: DUF4301 family protein, partial [Candidatus Eisenbacteria bacterium]|nr:DUF4301 family protein [Candidatus Eisenbacteria bacterium]
NLEAAGADLVFLRNIDNIEAEHPVRAPHIYRERLAGVLLAVEEEIGQLLHRLETDVADERLLREAFAFVERTLCRTVAPSIHREPLSAQVGYLIGQLSRPLRVCGMVPNAGEPGGGPFWVRHGDGSTSIQIVEKTQIQVQDPTQRALLEAATHFNPVDLVCSLKGRDGRPYRLAGFVDAESGLITEKTAAGRVLRALEWPGLWNGAMARWNTVFVELPLETFNPVKTVLDLLRPAHRG